MSQLDSKFMERAHQAQDQLSEKFLHHPQVSLIDIGYDPEDRETNKLVLRVHLRRASDKGKINLPTEINGIPVRVVTADYRLE